MAYLVSSLPLVAQCPPPSADIVVTGASTTNYTLNSGDTLHLASGAIYTGKITLQGGVVFICADAAQSIEIDPNSNAGRSLIYNYSDLNLEVTQDFEDVDIYNHNIITQDGDLTLVQDGVLHNYGSYTTTNKMTLDPGGMVHNFGDLTITDDLRIQPDGSFYSHNSSTLDGKNLIMDGYFYNAGKNTLSNSLNQANTGKMDIAGGCFNIASNFINAGLILGQLCGTLFLDGGGGNNTGTISGTLAIVNPDEASHPYLNSNSGTVAGTVQGTSCGCPGMEEICGNTIDDDLDGLVDAADPDCDAYADCRRFTIDPSKVSGVLDLINYPMLIDLTDVYLRNSANGGSMEHLNGFDIRFKTNCNVALLHQIERYEETNGRLVVWVKIPVLSAVHETIIEMEFGNTSVSTDASSEAVWSSSYNAVWHLDSDFNDKTTNGLILSNIGTTNSAGKIGDGRDCNGSGGYLSLGTTDLLKEKNEATLSIWIKSDVTMDDDHVLCIGTGRPGPTGASRAQISIVNDQPEIAGRTDDYEPFYKMRSDNTISTNTWYHVVGTIDYTNDVNKIYVNGVLQTGTTYSDATPAAITYSQSAVDNTSSSNSGVGSDDDGAGNHFDGTIDEPRILDKVLTAGWIATEYANQNSPSTFYSVSTCACPNTLPPEDCSNAIDDDLDGLTDCDDPDCGVAITGEGMGKIATYVYSQEDFVSAVYNALDSTFGSPADVAVDPTTGKLFISDPTSNRILRYPDAATFFTGGKAESVLGQPDFLTTNFTLPATQTNLRNPQGICIDQNGSLFVADYYFRRVLRYDNASSKAIGAPADGVLGKADFDSYHIGLAQDDIDYCSDVAISSTGSLILSDRSNKRILIWHNAASLPDGAPADIVLGKPDFVTNTPFTTSCTQTNLNSCWAIELIGNSLYVGDDGCNRILVWDNVFSKSNGAPADRVLGQFNFTSNTSMLNQMSVNQITGMEHDGNGNLYVSDSYHDRVMFFKDANALSNGANATSVIGQPDFVTNGPGTSATQIKDPRGMELVTNSGQEYLMLLDNGNYRALMFPQSISTDEMTAVSGTLHGSDPAGTGSLTFSTVTQPVLGTVTIDDPATGDFTYTPTGACMLNKDSVLTYTYRVTNGNGCFLDANLSILVTDVQDCYEICGNGIDDNNDGRIDEDLPAGVSDNLLLWLRADQGFSATTWEDYSAAENDATVYGDPTLVTNSLNFNPGINFDGDDHVEIPLSELVFSSGTHHAVLFMVYKPSTAALDIGMFGNQSATEVQNLYLQWNQVGKGNGSVVTFTPFGAVPHLITLIIDEEDLVGGGVSESKLYRNGTLDQSFTFNETASGDVDVNFHVGKGGSHPTTSKFFQGDIHELILYYENDGTTAISDAEREKIQSYLAIKYGISLSHDYTDSQ